ncbi:MAG: DNA primase [Kiritimatiellae bacterium]|nr:DNA primase [Kiritimatiellia bacterium]
MTVPQSTLEEIKARVDLADLIGSRTQLRRAGRDYKACCPFHHEKTPSFVVHPDKGFYHCFGCGEHGDCFTFLMKQDGLTFMEAVKQLAQQTGVQVEEKEDPEAGLRKRLYALHAELAAFYRRCLLQAPEAQPARDYLASREIPDETAEAFLVGYAPARAEAMLKWAEKHKFTPEELEAAGVLLPPRQPGDRWFHRFGGRLVFSIKDRSGRVVAFSARILTNDKKKAKYVNSPETAVFKKSNVLYAFDRAAGEIVKAPRREAIVCEGQIDVIRCHACGFATAVASEGTAFTEEHVRLLKKCADSVVLVFDGDAAGRKATVKTGGLFLAAEMPVRVASLPSPEDPDSFLRKEGAEAFRAILDKGESITSFQVRTLREAEANPGTIDAVSRVSRAALETIAKCPSAVMRAALLQEAASLLKLPQSALEEDLAKIQAAAKNGGLRAPRSEPPRAASAADVPAAATVRGDAPEPPPPDEDAGSPANNPPSAREMAFMEFLFENERDPDLAALVAQCAPEGLFAHPFTRGFVRAWLAAAKSGGDEIAELRDALPPAECAWLDAVLLGTQRASMSELGPVEILQDFLRQLWTDRVRRQLGALDAASTPGNDRRRLELTMLSRKFQRDRWETLAPLMAAL